MRNFRELEIWKEAMDLTNMVFDLIQEFPNSELYGLSSQLNRSSISIPSNIAEGSSRSSDRDFKRYLEIALGSSFEVETQLELAIRRGYLNLDKYNKTLEKLHILQKKMNRFHQTIKNRIK